MRRTRSFRGAASLSVVAAVAASLAVLTPVQAQADTAVPYSDPAATGGIALCDVAGHQLTSGSTLDKPFVWRAVGATRPPAPYDAPGRTAYLAAYQPRQGVAPGDWSGTELAATSRYTNPAHPISQGTPIASSLAGFLEQFPAEWNGLVQLRLIVGGSDRSPRTDAYDATDIQVTGTTWRVLRGGSTPCNAGGAVSSAVLLGVRGAKGTPAPRHSTTPSSAGASSAPGAAVATSSPSVAASGSTSGSSPTASTSAPRSSSLAPVVVVAVVAVLLGVGLVLWVRRRRGSQVYGA